MGLCQFAGDCYSFGCREIKGAPVGSEGRETFPDTLALDLRSSDDLVVPDVINLHVGIQVEHLDYLIRLDVESLAGAVC